MDDVVNGLVVFLVLGVYLAPAIVAFKRKLRPRWFITAFTILAGWTVLGWLIAMVWAVISSDFAEAEPAVAAAGNGGGPDN